MADAATRKRKLQELEDKLGKFEETLKGHGSRPDMVELRFEESQQYRFLRNENSPARVMSKVVRWNARPSEHPQHCFHDAPMDMSEAGEEVLQAKASEISGGKRALPTKKERGRSSHSGSLSHQALPGEPSRLVGESERKVIGWALNVRSKLDNGGQLQVYPDRGPQTRAKGKGNVKGKGKGPGRGKGHRVRNSLPMPLSRERCGCRLLWCAPRLPLRDHH